MEPTPADPLGTEASLENLSGAFGFSVPPSLAGLVQAAQALRPEAPWRALEPLGLHLGGPLFAFLGGSPVSLRSRETPPELFPFAWVPDLETHFGLVVDDPGAAGGAEHPVASLDPKGTEGCRLEALSLPEFLGARAASLPALRAALEPLGLPAAAVPSELAAAAREARDRASTYRTEDRLGVVVPEEPAPLELIALDSRRHLLGSRDRGRILACGRRALRVGAPGAALALARDLLWQLGHRAEWYRVAVDLMEECYPTLKRPLLARISRREWARFSQPGPR